MIRLRDGSSAAAARRLGIDPGALDAALSGRWEDLTLDLMAAVVTAYRVDTNWLVCGEGTRHPAEARLQAPEMRIT